MGLGGLEVMVGGWGKFRVLEVTFWGWGAA